MNVHNQVKPSSSDLHEDVVKAVMKKYNMSMSPLDVIHLTIKILSDQVVSSISVVFVCCHDIEKFVKSFLNVFYKGFRR